MISAHSTLIYPILKNKENYERHILHKELAKAAKEEDKILAKTSDTHLTACFDL